MQLFDYFRSSASYRVRIGLALKGLAVDHHAINLVEGMQHSVQYQEISVSHFVPTLVTETGEVLGQSLAILRYLDRLHPTPQLFPDDPLIEARTLEMALTVACDIHPLNNLRVLNYLRDHFGADQQARDEWYRHWVSEGLATMERLVVRHGGSFCLGNQLSIADVCLVPQMFNARRFNTDLSAMPHLVAIDARLLTMPAFADTSPAAKS